MIYFVTGTDTDVGKTLVSTALLKASQGLTLGLKPIAAGCEPTPQGLRNADALSLQGASRMSLAYEQLNPIALAPPIAPHIAATQAGEVLSVARLEDWLTPMLPQLAQCDLCLVEGAGGWRLPLNEQETLPDWVKLHDWPVILVVGMKLGCLNHALLTLEAIQADGLTLAGWVANRVDPDMAYYQENLETLRQRMPAPLLAEIPHLTKTATLAPAVATLRPAAQSLSGKGKGRQG
ncbi:dethiobiotin synthase [Ferrimonas marina]|uniref:ATP-dependent dethiobiotin synthetase BioD n=1 Tax=Ferrimonas marina TaxID=299255 RepID=A0A1M5YUY7_9GAMM|nr:dethiobiotin synthase [Ferrimonas marina]SHI15660.1 dethiobiotin synthetase [Ferrimonas marina]